jgi:hypothetical protein
MQTEKKVIQAEEVVHFISIGSTENITRCGIPVGYNAKESHHTLKATSFYDNYNCPYCLKNMRYEGLEIETLSDGRLIVKYDGKMLVFAKGLLIWEEEVTDDSFEQKLLSIKNEIYEDSDSEKPPLSLNHFTELNKSTLDFKPSEELLLFAEEFSIHIKKEIGNIAFENFCIQNISDNLNKTNSVIYTSKYRNHTIRLLNGETNVRSQDYLTFVRISHLTGIIDFNVSKLENEKFSVNYIFYIVIWCVICREVKDFDASDKIALQYYLTTGKPKKDILIGYVEMFTTSVSNRKSNLERMSLIEELLKD